jgi:hypothetical protein
MRHSTLDTRHSTLDTRHSTLDKTPPFPPKIEIRYIEVTHTKFLIFSNYGKYQS